MPTKGSFTSNVFEQLEEIGKKTVKSTASAVNSTFNPLKIVEDMTTAKPPPLQEAEKMKAEAQKGKSSTPLDFEKLSKSYEKQDMDKLAAVRRQFQSVKQGEEKAIEERKKEEEERKKKELQEDQQKKHQEEQLRQQQAAAGAAPQGKQKRGMMGKKKQTQEKHQEIKPATGKQ